MGKGGSVSERLKKKNSKERVTKSRKKMECRNKWLERRIGERERISKRKKDKNQEWNGER